VDKGRIVLQRLHQVRHQRILEQHGHGAGRLQIPGEERVLVAAGGDDDLRQTPLEILERGRKAENGHDLRGDRDVEPGLAGIAIGDAAQRADDLAQRPIVHVEHPPPGDAARVDAELVPPIDVVVDHRREEIVGGGDGVEISGKVQVDIVHRHDLGVAAAGSAPLHAEARTKRGLAEADDGTLADAVETIAQADRGGGLALAGGCRGDGGDEDQLAVGAVLQGLDVVQADLGFGMTIGNEVLGPYAETLADVLDRPHLGGPGNFNVAFGSRHG
jgi:hypothetical protein